MSETASTIRADQHEYGHRGRVTGSCVRLERERARAGALAPERRRIAGASTPGVGAKKQLAHHRVCVRVRACVRACVRAWCRLTVLMREPTGRESGLVIKGLVV